MKVLAFSTATFAAVILAAGCSSTDTSSSSQSQAVQGGSVDTTHNFAVGVCVGNGPGQCQLLCSGALIAPNLVMTARHCVDQSPQAIDCTSASTVFGAQYAPVNYYYITTNYQMGQSTKGWHSAKQIFTTPGTKVCGNDMALIMLTDNVPIAEAGGSFVTPVVQYPMTDHTRYSTTVTAIGYGDTSATTQDAGTRHILQNINLGCIPGDKSIDCPQQVMTQMTVNEFISGDSTCEGDSGSSAYEQKAFNKTTPVPLSFGVLSRGGSSGSVCVQPVYTRTDMWKDFIVNTALTAASAGGYTAPSWTQAPPPPGTDAGTDSGTTSDGATPPPPGSLGAPCSDPSECDSGLCTSNDGGTTYICSQNCDPYGDGSDCGNPGFTCVGDGQGNGYCFPKPPETFNNQGGGCAIGKSDPSKPVPWGTVVIAGAWVFAFGVRRRNKR